MSDFSSPSPEGPSPRQVLLGLFVIGQLAFLVLSNALGFYQEPQDYLKDKPKLVPEEVAKAVDRAIPGYVSGSGHAWQLPKEAATPLKRWSQATAQTQSWSLFAPTVFMRTGFPAIVFVDDEFVPVERFVHTIDLLNVHPELPPGHDGLHQIHCDAIEPPALRTARVGLARLAASTPLEATVLQLLTEQPARTVDPVDVALWRSDNEPDDIGHFIRFGHFRMRRFEGYLMKYLQVDEGESLSAARERWRERIREHVTENGDSMLIYLKWRLDSYQRRFPDRPPPQQLILVERVWTIRPPDYDDTGWSGGDPLRGPRTLPIARWQPNAKWPDDHRAIECYNPVTERFENILK